MTAPGEHPVNYCIVLCFVGFFAWTEGGILYSSSCENYPCKTKAKILHTGMKMFGHQEMQNLKSGTQSNTIVKIIP